VPRSWLLLLLDTSPQDLTERRPDVARPPLQAKPRRYAHHGANSLRVLAKIDRLAKRQLGVEVLQRDGSAGKRLDQRNLDRTQLVMAAKIGLDVGDQAVERLGCVRAAVKLGTG
jgi:hypothetical protein